MTSTARGYMSSDAYLTRVNFPCSYSFGKRYTRAGKSRHIRNAIVQCSVSLITAAGMKPYCVQSPRPQGRVRFSPLCN